jgi:type II secretory pathway pseudopilin PulG
MNAVALPFPALSHPRFGAKRRYKAFGLLEVILVFAIVIGAAAVVFTVFNGANGSANAARVVDETNLIAANVRSSPWGMSHDYSTLPAGQFIPGIFPSSWNVNGQAVDPSTGVSAQIGPGFTNQQFNITLNYEPTDGAACAKMLSSFAADGYDDVWAAGPGPTDSGASVCASTNPCKVDMTKVAAWCSGTLFTDGPSFGFSVFAH